MSRWLLAAVLVPLLMVGARWDYDTSNTVDVLEQYGPRTRCITWAESKFDPNAIGRAGELGAVQLLPPSPRYPQGGLLSAFNAWAAERWPDEQPDPFNPYMAVPFLDWALQHGMSFHWTTARYC